jgi:hypothetical protein
LVVTFKSTSMGFRVRLEEVNAVEGKEGAK